MRNRIKQVPQKREAALPDSLPSRASKQSGPSPAQRRIRETPRETLDPFRWDTELLYSRVILGRLVMLAENSHDNEV